MIWYFSDKTRERAARVEPIGTERLRDYYAGEKACAESACPWNRPLGQIKMKWKEEAASPRCWKKVKAPSLYVPLARGRLRRDGRTIKLSVSAPRVYTYYKRARPMSERDSNRRRPLLFLFTLYRCSRILIELRNASEEKRSIPRKVLCRNADATIARFLERQKQKITAIRTTRVRSRERCTARREEPTTLLFHTGGATLLVPRVRSFCVRFLFRNMGTKIYMGTK